MHLTIAIFDERIISVEVSWTRVEIFPSPAFACEELALV